MRRYFFGYLFVRFAKIIAVLVLLGGAGGGALRYFQGSLEAASVRYEPGRLLAAKLFTLSQEWDRARFLVAEYTEQAPIETKPFQISKAPGAAADFDALDQQLAVVQTEREAMKNALVQQFENLVVNIEQKLRAHAASLKQKQQQPIKRPPGQQANSGEPDPVESASPKTLYAPLDRAEFALRRDALIQGKDFLSVLHSSAENPDNAKILAQATDELGRLESLLPASLESAKRQPAPAQNAENPAAAESKPNAELVADQLQQIRGSIRTALLTEWAVDHAFDATATEAEHEQKRCIDAERSLKRLWLNVDCSIALLVLGSVCAAFLILVLADLTQALLDSATNSALVASAYQNAGGVREK